ncbi:MAG: peptidoglycan-binding protein [Comamonadaceae bacterium CG1_02_60_18]|nr:MAG: peptidoglycan-binding protein [Comamonadaceae bacterium CG1_02_60_18]
MVNTVMAKPFSDSLLSSALGFLAVALLSSTASQAQPYPVTPEQRATAQQAAQRGVALSELRADTPVSHTVVPGDTLWNISGLFLKSPWRWPELWGMNLADIKNPHLIYPGQTLYLIQANGRATLTTQATAQGSVPTVKLSPRVRAESLTSGALPTLQNHLIEPFLAEPLIVDEATLSGAPRIVSAQDSRVLLTRGDRAYARSASSNELIDNVNQAQRQFRVFRNATPLKDPVTAEVLGYEAQYIGKALLARSETTQETLGQDGKMRTEIVPATIDIVKAKEEMRAGDRLLPEPAPQIQSYVPHAPRQPVDARIVSVYGSAVVNAAQNQVVAINRGTADGIESGHVLAILQDGARVVDKTDPTLPTIKLPDERNGLLMVFRTFDKLSYALVLDITNGVKIGDRLVNPL